MKRNMKSAGFILLLVCGCVTNPITGSRQFNMVSQSELLSLSRQAAPAQFAADKGVCSDQALNAYVSRVGRRLLATLQPSDMIYPDMPFSFQVVNATYINAYAFPDGTIAVTRGMILAIENEAQLAAVLAHEITHVNCGHTASAMSKSGVLNLALEGTDLYLGQTGSSWGTVAKTGGQLVGSALLAKYSRDQEREADLGGMDYMVRARYTPQGMVDLMKILVRISNSNPSALEQMFATHPMSTERLNTAIDRRQRHYAHVNGIDNAADYAEATANLRRTSSR